MPDPIVQPAPTTTPVADTTPSVATPTPQQSTPVQESDRGSLAFVNEMEEMINPPKPQKKVEEKKPEKQPEPKAKEAEETKPKEEDKPKIEPVKEKDPVSLRKRLTQIEDEYKGFKLTAQQEREKLAAKIAEFEKRKYLTPEQEAQQTQLQKQLETVQSELYSRDYKESPEFKAKYQAKWEKSYGKAKAEVESMVVETVDPTTEEKKSRQATLADFERVRALSSNAVAQQDLAEQLFGKYAGRVLNHINNLGQIEEQANDEIQQHRATWAEKQKQRQEMMQQFGEQFSRTHSEVNTALETKYPEYFGKTEDEESNAAFAKGREFIEKTLQEADTLPIGERAARAAVINRWAAAFPRMVYLANSYKTKFEEAQKQIEELRGTDPGSGGDNATPTPSKKSMGTDDLIAEFDKLS